MANQFFGVAADSWVVALGVDLILAIRNPFSVHAQYRHHYHAGVWGFALLLTLVPMGAYGVSLFNMCWIKEEPCHGVSFYALVTHFFVLFGFFVFLVGVLVYTRRKFSRGMRRTALARQRVLNHSYTYVRVFGAYWMVLCLAWIAQGSYTGTRAEKSSFLIYVWIVLMSLRGPIDALAWIITVSRTGDHHRRRRATNILVDPEIDLTSRRRATLFEALIPRDSGENWVRYGELGGLTDAELEHIEKNLNEAIRRDVMSCTTLAIQYALSSEESELSEVDVERFVHTPAELGNVSFKMIEYRPRAFSHLRQLFGVSNADFLKSFSHENDFVDTLRERFTEGRSGSFMYFTRDNIYILKTLTAEERDVLLEILPGA
jgi:1-phosphatidylinositol-4-phosphate 5-kinase